MTFQYDLESTTPNPGDLTTVLFPQGGAVDYAYKKLEWIPEEPMTGIDVFKKNIELSNPIPESNSATPRVWYGSDYILILWFDVVLGKTSTQLIQWGGRWSEPWTWNDLPCPPIKDDLQNIRVLAEPEYCVVYLNTPDYYANTVFTFQKKQYDFGQWSPDTLKTHVPNAITPDETALTGGNEFFVLHPGGQPSFARFDYDPESRSWQEPFYEGLSSTMAISARNNVFLIAYYQSGRIARGEIHYKDLGNEWHKENLDLPNLQFTWHPKYANQFWTLAESFAAGTYEVRGDEAEMFIIMWGRRFQNIRRYEANLKAEPFKTEVNDSVIYSGRHLYHYNGNKWISSDFSPPKPGENRYAYSDNFALLSNIQGDGTINTLSTYDPYRHQGAGAWSRRDFGRTEGAYSPSISGNVVTVGGRSSTELHAGNFQKSGSCPPG